MRTFDLNGIILEENFEGFRDWTEAATFFGLTDAGGIVTPSIDFEGYMTTGQRKHLALALNNTTGAAQDVRVSFGGNGFKVWVHNTVLDIVGVTMGFRYKADAGLSGCTAKFSFANSPFAGNLAVAAVCDGEWHNVTGPWSMQVDANLFTGGYVEVSDIPAGADGVFRFDDIRLTRNGNIRRVIDNACPIAWMRPNWRDGIRERYRFPTHVHAGDDGSERREQLRLIPAWRLQYAVTSEDELEAARIDAWLWRYLGQRVAVPRWMDAIPYSSVASSGHELFMRGEIAQRWFQARQRALIWESPTKYESIIIDTITNGATSRITTDPLESAVVGSYRVGPTLVVPLVPARLSSDLPLGRPNNALTDVPLVFEGDVVQ